MTQPNEPTPDEIEDDGTRDTLINDENPEDPDDSNTEDDSEPEIIPGTFGASARTWPILEQILSYFPNRSHVYVTATTGGTHATNSYHYRGEAIDVGSGSQSYKDQLAAWLYPYYGYITELIHSKAGNHTGWYVKNGRKVSHGYYGSTTTAAHVNHVHFAIASVASANKMLAVVKKNHAATNPSGFPGTLHSGSTGANVKKVQAKVGVTADGSYGPKTVAAVKKYQAAHKLHVDGEVGAQTWAALF